MENISKAVEKYKDLILEAERYIWKHPETGYREWTTSKYMEEKFEELGYELTKAQNIPGFYTLIDTKKEGPTVLILGELDSLIVPSHKEADQKTGYVHACGHNVHCATLLGIAAALKEPGVCDGFSGKIMLCAVPAEELIELDYRAGLKKQGIIKYMGGKSEFLSRGYFDGVDLAFMVHAGSKYCVLGGHIGCIVKTVHYKGVSSHAGGAPWLGVNALYAANQGLVAANALRETFKEEDMIRFHPIITHGGDAVNAIPELVTIESFVRGRSFEAIMNANKKINQALIGAALSINANIEIIDIPGYAPQVNDKNLIELSKEASDMIIPEENFKVYEVLSSGSTDMGDLSMIMPVLHPNSAGAKGVAHGENYYIEDPYRACVKSAKLQIMMLKLLLENNAKRANKIIREYKSTFKSKEEYLKYINAIYCDGDRIEYKNDGSANVKLD